MLEKSTPTTCHTKSTEHKHSQPRNARAGALMVHHPAWVVHHTAGPGQYPQYTLAWYARKAAVRAAHSPRTPHRVMVSPTTPMFIQHGSGASVGPGRECTASVLLVMQVLRRAENKTTCETHCEANGNFPVLSVQKMLTIAACTHADRAERASMVSVRTVAIMILDSRKWTSTERKYVKTLTIVVLARLFEHWRPDASENPIQDFLHQDEKMIDGCPPFASVRLARRVTETVYGIFFRACLCRGRRGPGLLAQLHDGFTMPL